MIRILDLGLIPYGEAYTLQKRLRQDRREEKIPDTLLLLEHSPVFTMGKRDSSEDFKISGEKLQKMGFDVVKTERGGKITYHGPGQLVGYLIFRLSTSIPDFVCQLEKKIIKILSDYKIEALIDSENPGVWVGRNKISAIGLHFERDISIHGFSLNVSCDLTPYQYINPCGFTDRGVTSMLKETGKTMDMKEVKEKVIKLYF